MNDNLIERLSDEAAFSQSCGVPRIAKLLDEARAAIERQSVPAGYVLVPNSLIDEFPEINPSNYGHDDACALNSWGCEVVTAALAAAPQPQPVQEPTPLFPPGCAGVFLERPQAQPLSDDQKQEIHNETGAGHALISLVESYITKGKT